MRCFLISTPQTRCRPPHRQPAAWGSGAWALMIAMWWTMMIAMMTPSAAPTILLYARVHRHSSAQRSASGQARADRRLCSRLPVGLARLFRCRRGVALGAGTHRARLGHDDGLAEPLAIRRRADRGGPYQLSPLKNVCLAHCRTPASFLSRHWRPRARARSGSASCTAPTVSAAAGC